MRVTDTHVYFWGGNFSNFWLTKIMSTPDCALQNFVFNCSEQLYMIEKALYFKDYESAYLMTDAGNGSTVKALGRKVKDFDEKAWDAVSYSKMLIACRAKFEQNEFLREALLDTGEKTIVEASPLDKIWGVGLHEDDERILDPANWQGENRLGRVLMQVREELK